MGLLEKFEQRVNRLVSGNFAEMFDSHVQPLEIASALQTEIHEKAVSVGAGRTVVPNKFLIELSKSDYKNFADYEKLLVGELTTVIREYVVSENYTTVGTMVIEMKTDDDLIEGVFRITSSVEDAMGQALESPVVSTGRRGPHLVIAGFAYPLTRTKTVLGRATDADIRIDDSGASRRHCEIELTSPITITDLGSTNGTWIHNEKITTRSLLSDTDITIGNTTIQFRMQ
ncbi:MAG: FhaA domain-containing protein [Candidatus Nanopelagicales bacterium]